MPAPTFIEQMVDKYEALLLRAPAAQSISVDGQSMSIADLEAKWKFWKQQLASESGSKATITAIQMGGV